MTQKDIDKGFFETLKEIIERDEHAQSDRPFPFPSLKDCLHAELELKLAREAYARYAAVTDNKNYQGLPMPEFDDLPDTIKKAWCAAIQPQLETKDQIYKIMMILGDAHLGDVSVLIQQITGINFDEYLAWCTRNNPNKA